MAVLALDARADRGDGPLMGEEHCNRMAPSFKGRSTSLLLRLRRPAGARSTSWVVSSSQRRVARAPGTAEVCDLEPGRSRIPHSCCVI